MRSSTSSPSTLCSSSHCCAHHPPPCWPCSHACEWQDRPGPIYCIEAPVPMTIVLQCSRPVPFARCQAARAVARCHAQPVRSAVSRTQRAVKACAAQCALYHYICYFCGLEACLLVTPCPGSVQCCARVPCLGVVFRSSQPLHTHNFSAHMFKYLVFVRLWRR